MATGRGKRKSGDLLDPALAESYKVANGSTDGAQHGDAAAQGVGAPAVHELPAQLQVLLPQVQHPAGGARGRGGAGAATAAAGARVVPGQDQEEHGPARQGAGPAGRAHRPVPGQGWRRAAHLHARERGGGVPVVRGGDTGGDEDGTAPRHPHAHLHRLSVAESAGHHDRPGHCQSAPREAGAASQGEQLLALPQGRSWLRLYD
ncbi:unnamed protein product [Phytophthora lilii]|uniref:Unnamed protein product n=1 Tax=Phytophthora lilii TaxID=2077276 RepID=A0A9W6WNE8_9STRA|nr:unnamed protein product [Phytophthora lilii]